MTYEMVHIEINWHEIGTAFKEGPLDDCLWFKVVDEKIIRVGDPRHEENQEHLFGSIAFTPMNTDGEFYITPYKSNIDVELDMVGLEEAFGAGDDVETLGAIAWQWRNAPYAGVESWYFTCIALYEVGVYTTHTEWGNDSETEYYLIGILETNRLPLALTNGFRITMRRTVKHIWQQLRLRWLLRKWLRKSRSGLAVGIWK